MTFIQLMEYTTSKPDDIKRVTEEWEEATRGKRTAKRVVMLQHRDDPARHCDLVFFDSSDAAAENSRMPETQEFARRQHDLIEGDVSYQDFEVIEDRAL